MSMLGWGRAASKSDNFEVPKINWKEVRPYLAMEHFNVETIESKNRAAAGLCAWVVNIVKYHDTIVSVEPKRMALKDANMRLSAANEKLDKVNTHVAGLTAKLKKLTVGIKRFFVPPYL